MIDVLIPSPVVLGSVLFFFTPLSKMGDRDRH
jgi:hypothetical protein